MKTKFLRSLSLFTATAACLGMFAGAGSVLATDDAPVGAQDEIRGIIINEDIDFINACNANTTREDLINYVYSHEGSQITDFMINVFCQIATYPSDVVSDFSDKYHYYTDQGLSVPDNRAVMAYTLFEEKNIDYIDIFCETFPKIGINPWLSYRMNDAHGVSAPEGVVAWKFFEENPQYRRVRHGSTTNTYYNNLFDYTHDEVREYMLAVINEGLSRYDCYGIELDFQREIWLWHTGGEYVGLTVLTDFMRELDRIVKTYEVKYGHDIKVGIRCASDFQTNYDFGLDVITWAAEGLIDLVNPTARYITTDFDVPVKSWVSIMHPFGVEVAPGLETIILGDLGGQTRRSDLPTASAAAANWYHQGADKIYLYNQSLSFETPGFSELDTRELDLSDTSFATTKGKWNARITLGSYENTLALDRRMILTYNDTKQTWANSNTQLPAKMVPGDDPITLRIPVGIIPEDAAAVLNIATGSFHVKEPPTVIINGVEAEYAGVYADKNEYVEITILSYKIPTEAYDDTYIVAQISPPEGKYLTITYAEVLIDVAN